MKKKISITAYTYGEHKNFNRVSDVIAFFEKENPTGWFIRFNGLSGDDYKATDFIRSQKSQPPPINRESYKATSLTQEARELRTRLQGIVDIINSH
jgi:hypothetical protein